MSFIVTVLLNLICRKNKNIYGEKVIRIMIRVLHVLGGLNRGGAETMVMNLYRNIDRSKVQFDFIVHTEDKCDYDDEIKSLGGRIYNIPKYTGKNHLHYKKAWSSFFEENPKYKIIHGHVRSTATIYLKVAKKYGLTTIAHSHNTSSGKGVSAIVKNILQHQIRYTAKFMFACSKTAGIWLFGYKACQKDNFYILNNAIDAEKFIYDEKKRMEKRKELQVEDKFIIGHMGRFHTQKNHNFLVDIFKQVHESEPNTVLMLVGEGDLRGSIEKKVNDLGLGNSVIFTGVRADIAELLQVMDVFVFPSLYEGLPLTVVEAQAAGLPCLISDKITAEVKIMDILTNISLEESVQSWAKKVLSYLNSFERKNTYLEIVKAGYDIKGTVNWLQEFYINQYE